jgi:hypothetical protein
MNAKKAPSVMMLMALSMTIEAMMPKANIPTMKMWV